MSAARLILCAALLLSSAQALAVNRWCSAAGTGDFSGTNPANQCILTSANVVTAFGGAVARGDTLFVCGPVGNGGAFNLNVGVGTGDGVSFFTINGLAAESGCAPGGWVLTGATVGVQVGGGGRNNVRVRGIYVIGGSIGANLGPGSAVTNSNFVVELSTFSQMTDSGVKLNAAADGTLSGVVIRQNQCSMIGTAGPPTPIGQCVAATPSVKGAGAASGLVTGVDVYENVMRCAPLAGRYGVSFYPPYTAADVSGRVRASRIYRNQFIGPCLYHAINLNTDTDGVDTFANSFVGTFGGAVIHVGGIGDLAVNKEAGCGFATSDGNIVRDHRGGSGSAVMGGVSNPFNPADGAGIYLEECTTGSQVLRNEIRDNEVAGLYFNDADSALVQGNVIADNGDNEVHVHGISNGNVLDHNSIAHSGERPTPFSDQGRDAVQIDATVTTQTTLTRNLIICGPKVPKCVDADSTVVESQNLIYTLNPTPGATGSSRAEGFTPDPSDINADPMLAGGLAPVLPQHFCPKAGSPLLGAGTYVGAWVRDFYGVPVDNPPSIGAIGRNCGPRGTVSNRPTL